MAKLSESAFAIMGMCENERKPFGITVDKRGNAYAFCWAFKMSKEQAAREGYDKTHVRGAIVYDDDFNGCPYCGSKGFYICNSGLLRWQRNGYMSQLRNVKRCSSGSDL